MALPELKLVGGLEIQFVVNHLGHFLFTTELLEPVKQAAHGRIVMLSSCAHHGAPGVGINSISLGDKTMVDLERLALNITFIIHFAVPVSCNRVDAWQIINF